MAAQPLNQDNEHKENGRNLQLDAIRIQLRSQRLSEIWEAFEKVRVWLEEHPEDHGVYGFLLDVVEDNPSLRERARNLLLQMSSNSKYAVSALQNLPSSPQDLMSDANDAYALGKFREASSLYRQVLKLDPENTQAKDQLAKSENRLMGENTDTSLPQAAVQYYRRARSHIAARDFEAATNLLNAAIEVAQKTGIGFPDAEETLSDVQDLLTADEFRQKAKFALEKSAWNDAIDLYEKAAILDPTNLVITKELDSMKALLNMESELNKKSFFNIFTSPSRFQNTLTIARGVVSPENPLLNLVERKISRIKLTRLGAFAALVTLIGIVFFLFQGVPPVPTPIETQTPVLVIIVPTSSPTETAAVQTVTKPAAPSTLAISSTNTFTPVPSPSALGIGYVNLKSVTAWQEPGAGVVTKLGLYQVVTILEKQDLGQVTYFRCSWEKDGVPDEGWILAIYIDLGPVPTP